jgi:hypothetical protein
MGAITLATKRRVAAMRGLVDRSNWETRRSRMSPTHAHHTRLHLRKETALKVSQ